MTWLNGEATHQAAASEPVPEHSTTGSARDNGTYDPVSMIDQLPVMDIPISSLERGLFLRGAGMDLAHAKLLAEAADTRELPPILVQEAHLRIIDGMHRIEAAKMRGETIIKARFVSCADEDAFILAVKSNTLHGLPLSHADRVFGAKRILAWHPEWSDRAIGAAAGLGARTIAALRRRSDGSSQQTGKRLGRDGKRHPVTGAEGRRRAADYIASRPDASLREIARETDVSLGTARDVRTRVQSGLEPVTAGRQIKSPEHSAKPDRADGSKQPASGAGEGNVRRITPQSDWAAISAKLMNDPSLKYAESGRAFIRWMALYATHTAEWREFIDAIPAHWVMDMTLLADGIREEWCEFTEKLRSRQSLVS